MDNTERQMFEERPIGIDLGTTNSVVATVREDGEPQILPNAVGERQTPSVVAFDDGEAFVGKTAANQAAQNPAHTVHSIKREMGRDDVVVEAPWGESYTPEEVSALICSKLIEDATAELDREVDSAVITVPAYFGNRQREATKQAGEIAGLTVTRLLNEPTAACFAYGLQDRTDGVVFVYDLGGGTFDASLVDTTGGVFEVLATNGHTQLGGEDWDARIVDRVLDRVAADTGVTLEDDIVAMERIWNAAQAAKHELSAAAATTISIPFLMTEPEYNLELELDRSTFEADTTDLLEETFAICDELFADVEQSPDDIEEVLLVGGATRMPQVKANVELYFGQEPANGIHPDEAVALGAAAQAGLIEHTTTTTSLPHDSDSPSDTLPAQRQTADTGEHAAAPNSQATNVATTNQQESSADAIGESAGGQATSVGGSGDLPARLEDVVLLDVTPKTLGVESRIDGEAGRFSPLIPRNTTVPATATQTYHTHEHDQQRVRIAVYQGEHEYVDNNELLDEFTLQGIPAGPAGREAVAVTFHIDEDGILDVTAEHAESDTAASITVESAFGRSAEQIKSMREGLPSVK